MLTAKQRSDTQKYIFKQYPDDSQKQDMPKKSKIISMPFHISKPILNKSHKYIRTGYWTRKQKNKFTIFLDYYKQLFKKQNRKKHKIFIYMAGFMKTRNPLQCRSHHQKQIKQYHELNKIIENRIIKIGSKQYQYYQRLYHEELSTIQFETTTEQICLHGKSPQKNTHSFLQKQQYPILPQLIKQRQVDKQHPTNQTHIYKYQVSQVNKEGNDDNDLYFYQNSQAMPNMSNIQNFKTNLTGTQSLSNLFTNQHLLRQYHQTINACNYYWINYVKASMKLHQVRTAKQ